MKSKITIFTLSLCVTLSILLLSETVVHATIIGSASFDAGAGKFIYSYTIDNSAEPVYEVTSWYLDISTFTADWTISDITVPAGWTADPPGGTQDFWAFSISWGGAAVQPGDILSGFKFPSIHLPGSVMYSETLFDSSTWDLDYSAGTTTGPTSGVIPEPGTLLLFTVGFAGVLIYSHIRRRNVRS
jgi:hypothetical protein